MDITGIHVPEQQTFNFQLDGTGTVYSFPKPQYLPRSLARRMSSISAITDETRQNIAGQEFIDLLFDKYAPALADDERLTPMLQMTIFKAWRDSATVTLGESPASAG